MRANYNSTLLVWVWWRPRAHCCSSATLQALICSHEVRLTHGKIVRGTMIACVFMLACERSGCSNMGDG